MNNAAYLPHKPVMVERVVEFWRGQGSGSYLDGTGGGGGHSAALLERLNHHDKLVVMDRDSDAVTTLTQRFANDRRVTVLHENFRDMSGNPRLDEFSPFAGILFDFGVSSHQIDKMERGFSHRQEASLDMRMDQRAELNASDLVNRSDLNDLTRVLKNWGEEPRASKIARVIVANRPITTTTRLAEVIRGAVPVRDEAKSVARVFQAIRIEVNGELNAIESALTAVLPLLSIGGRFVAMSYHSLEDRIVKTWLREQYRNCSCPPHLPCTCGGDRATMKPVVRGHATATEEEVKDNPRARSVRVRAAERIK